MRRVTRYILQDLRTPTLLALCLWTFFLYMNHLFFVAKEAVTKDLSWSITGQLLFLYLPHALILAIPMATLLGTLIAVGRLSADHEIVALQGAGLGPGTLLRPVLLHGLLATVVALLVYGVLQPMASYATRTLKHEIATTTNYAADLRPRVFYDTVPGLVLFADEILPGSDGRLDRVLFYQADPEQLILAQEAYLRPAGNGTLQVELREGVGHLYRTDTPETYRPFTFERYLPTRLDPPRALQAPASGQRKRVVDMNPGEILTEVREAHADPNEIVRPYRIRAVFIELHQRIALPVACLIFAVLALPLGITRARSGKGAGFALSLLVILVYWVTFTAARDLAMRAAIPVMLGVWLGDIVTGAWALYALVTLRSRLRNEPGFVGRIFGALTDLVRRILGSLRTAPSPTRGEISRGPAPTNRIASILDRYIASLFFRTFLLAVASCYAIYFIVEIKELLDGVLQRNQPLSLVLSYLQYFAPGRIDVIFPIAALVGAVITLTLLGRTGELTAMKAGGVSMTRASAPILVVTLILCAVFFFVQDRVAPLTNRRAQEIKDQLLGRAPRTYGMPPGGRWTFGTEGRLYHYRLYDPDTRCFQGLAVYNVDLQKPSIDDHRFAASACWAGGRWTLEDGWQRDFREDPVVGLFRQFDRIESSDLDPPDHFARREVTWTRGGNLPEQLNLEGLRSQIASLADSGYDTTRLRVAYHAKLSHPFTPLVMVLLGIPFAFRVGRRGSLYGVGVALILVIVYWATFAVFNALGLETILTPALAAWAPNVLYALVGSYLMLFVKT